ncbi:MAG: FtsW/RodA/SpoVE family cell cycle protein [Chloroflexi bacterium]|nr:FtsW/RodA/SpoVE family cell cycle protein [Chloroflexota bacterium]MBP8054901.1 FtsW/RodA/SpoVE family cell cycle protein [Chloroflexota bacterium]
MIYYQEPGGRREFFLLLLAATFVFLNAITLSLVLAGQILLRHLAVPLIWLGLMALTHFLLNRYRPFRDPFLLPLVALLTGWGMLLQERLAPNFMWRQTLWLALSAAAFLVIAIVPRNLRWLRRYRYTWLTLGLLLLLATIAAGVNPSGLPIARYWLSLPFVSQVFFQPSELLKLLLVVFLASYFHEREKQFEAGEPRNWWWRLAYLGPLLLMWGFCLILLVWQRDLGAAALFFILFLALLYLATGNQGYVLGGMILLLAAGVLAYFAFDVVALRVDAWWDPWPEADNRAFQIVQSLYAVAAGGLLGQGIGQGFPDYIPVVHSDFAFAAIAEEWGIFGALVVILCFALLAYRGLRLAYLTQQPFSRYLAAGIVILLSAQAFLIMGGVTKFLPLTGVTLPFISYGGSSLLMSWVMVGLLMYLSGEGHTQQEV